MTLLKPALKFALLVGIAMTSACALLSKSDPITPALLSARNPS